MKSILISLIEKYHPFNIRYFKLLVVLGITLLSGIVLILGWMSFINVREVVTEDFNQQQLAIAKHVASQIENRIAALKRELVLLSLSPTIQYAEARYLKYRINITFSSIKEDGVMEIRYIDHKTHASYTMASDGKWRIHHLNDEDKQYLNWAKKEHNKNNIYLSSVSTAVGNSTSERLVMKMCLPVWQTSVSEMHPSPTNQFSGVLIFVINSSELVKQIAKDVHSGKTGYAWVIDENGTFLYHYEKTFIGKNAFQARMEKQPSISYERINEIQRNQMIKGEEGTSWYISGWHKGMEGEIKKLIAFTPIRLSNSEHLRIWSVAVVAPVSEIEGAIHSIHVRQLFLQGLIIFIIIVSGLIINFMILGWSNMLEQEVAKKTIELTKSEQRYKSLIENAEDIIFTTNYEGNILSINSYGCRFFNKSEGEIIGHNIAELFSWPSGEVLLLMIQNVFDTKESTQVTQLAVIGKNQYWFNTKLRRLWDETGNIYAVLGISRDITAIKEKEKEEQRLQLETEKLSSMGTLAAGVAHEINNPLAIILGFTDLLIERVSPDSQEYTMLKTIEKQGLIAKRVVENLLSFGRYTEYKAELVDVNAIVETVLSIVKNTLFLNKIKLNKRLQPDLPKIMADVGELEQVFVNIINNAIYAMKGGGTLTVVTSALDSKQVEIRLSDTGHGIKKEHRSKIFDPLFTTKKVGEGTGLGLSVSYGIVTKHGGTITFQTKTEEESAETGTTFIITFPANNKETGINDR